MRIYAVMSQRCCAAPVRRSRCFARSVSALERLLRLLLTAYNRCCVFRYLYPQRHFYPGDFLPALF